VVKIAVYTCILPYSYTTLRSPLVISEDVDYIAFVDNPDFSPPEPWQVRLVTRDPDLTPRRDLQSWKMLSHKTLPDYQYVVWQDGNVRLKVTPEYLVQLLRDSGKKVAFGRHPWRYCSYEEGRVCAGFKSNSAEIIEAQLNRYREEGFPEQYGLIASTFFFRNNRTRAVSDFFDLWYDETMKGSHRNQVSWGYAAWKSNLDYLELEIPWGNNALYRMGE